VHIRSIAGKLIIILNKEPSVSETTSARKSISKSGLLFFLLAIILTATNALLLKQNIELKAIVAKRIDRPKELDTGVQIPPLKGMAINGNEVVVGYGEDKRKTILFCFTPGCSPCEDNMTYWKAMIKGINRDLFRLVGVSLTPETTLIKEFVSRHGLDSIIVISQLDNRSRESYGLASTPQTILISPDGKVEKVWTGLLEGQKRIEVEESLGISLPTGN
jgi:peroxiredoxin